MKSILLVQVDEKTVQTLREAMSSPREFTLHSCMAEEAQTFVLEQKPDMVFLNISKPEVTKFHLLQNLRRQASTVPVIVIADKVSTSLAIKAMREGALDYVIKPLEVGQLRALLTRLARMRQKMPSRIPPQWEDSQEEIVFVGEHPEMLEIYKLIGRVAPSSVPVLIQGESGTGKELVANEIHRHSDRIKRRFLAVNCAAIPEALLESELFGHEAGAFTGAVGKRKGRFEQADGGTIFLDEVADMSATTQSKVLRVLEQHEFERLGGTETIHVDIRVLAATNRSLVKCMQEGKFRVDLFYRLRGAFICLPPLRNRGDDIRLLAEHFVYQFAQEAGKNIKGLHPKSVEKMMAYSWPGNIRELRNVIHTAVVFCHGEMLLPEHIVLEEQTINMDEVEDDCQQVFVKAIEPLFDRFRDAGRGHLYHQMTSALEKVLIQMTMARMNNNQVKAADFLGISRNTLRDRLKKYGL